MQRPASCQAVHCCTPTGKYKPTLAIRFVNGCHPGAAMRKQQAKDDDESGECDGEHGQVLIGSWHARRLAGAIRGQETCCRSLSRGQSASTCRACRVHPLIGHRHRPLMYSCPFANFRPAQAGQAVARPAFSINHPCIGCGPAIRSQPSSTGILRGYGKFAGQIILQP
jgi:hypothetical protein